MSGEHVYFVQSGPGGPVKIGFGLAECQMASTLDLKLYGEVVTWLIRSVPLNDEAMQMLGGGEK